MKHMISKFIAFSVVIFYSCGGAKDPKNNMTSGEQTVAPVAKKIAYNLSEHGDTRVDNYYWMRLSDEQKNAPAARQR